MYSLFERSPVVRSIGRNSRWLLRSTVLEFLKNARNSHTIFGWKYTATPGGNPDSHQITVDGRKSRQPSDVTAQQANVSSTH